MYDLMKYVTFKKCFVFCILGFALAPVFTVLNKFVSEKISSPLFSIEAVIFFLLDLYVYVGFIKYSFIVQEEKFRKITFLAIGILFLNFFLSFFQDKDSFISYSIFNNLSLMPLAYILLYYSFSLIHNEEVEFFKKLSRLNLYTFLISIIFVIFILLLTKGFTLSIRWIFSFPFIVVSGVILLLKLYWEVNLFKHLSFKYDR
jgi:hypothetical protein